MTAPVPATIEHLFSVDVEEHFQVVALQRWSPRSTWDGQPSRVVANVDRLLDLLARHGAVGTFFTLGWVAERQPDLIRRIAAAGHEIASHGWWHTRVTRLTPEEFREEIRSSRALLEDISGQRVLGFRAPSSRRTAPDSPARRRTPGNSHGHDGHRGAPYSGRGRRLFPAVAVRPDHEGPAGTRRPQALGDVLHPPLGSGP
jgi:peptidoglycan/xylan/chitin deacetylase (PgdA/CDA1 family)